MKIINLKIAFRNALRSKTVTVAKLFGLSVSFAVILFAAGYIFYETSFDKHVPDKELIYRCYMEGQLNLEDVDYAVTSPAMAQAMVDEIPEINKATRFQSRGSSTYFYDDVSYEGGEVMVADTNFFSFFSIPYISNTEIPLIGNNDIAIARSIAERDFGSVEEALGKRIRMRADDYTITTVFNDLPSTSHIQVKIATSILKENWNTRGWGSQFLYTYFKTDYEIKDLEALNLKLTKLVYTYDNENIDGASATTWEELKYAPGYFIFYIAEPLLDIHFTNHKFDASVTSSKIYVYGTLIIAILILLISTLNYLNLNLASISMRLREIGVQKTMGAGRFQVFKQFLQETNLFWILSFLMAVIIYKLFGVVFSKFTGFNFELSNRQTWAIIASLFILLLVVNVLVNVIPIFLVSAKRPVRLLKEKNLSALNFSGNNGFIFIQFVLSLIIVIGAFFVQRQINYMITKNRGYDSENVINFYLFDLDESSRASFIDELRKNPTIKSIGTCGNYFGDDPGMGGCFFNTETDENYFHTSFLTVDAEFGEVYNFKMAEGRFFDKTRTADVNTAVINEAAAREYRSNESLVGQKIVTDRPLEIIGIVKDFNYRSLHHKVEPLVITNYNNLGMINARFEQDNAGEVIALIENLWKEFNVPDAFDYHFHDQQLATHYTHDEQAKRIMLALSIISIIIASVGLYAVSIFTITRKTKEIGIHKVNGAKTNELLLVINKKFLMWIVLALITAMPLSYYLIDLWLNNFAFRTPMNWWVFVLSGIVAFGIALITVSWQSWRAATRNPVEALRYE